MPKDEERLSGEIRDGYPDYCQTLSFTDANGVVKQLVFPKALDLDRPKRARTTFSEQQLDSLEEAFKSNQYLVGKDRMVLSNELGLSETQVKVWFQNRRTKHKKDQDKKTQTTNALAESRATKNVLQMLELKSPSSGPFPPLSPPSPILTTPPSAIELRHPDQPSQNSLSPHCKPKWNSADGAFVQSDRNNSHHHHSHNYHRRVAPQPYYYHHHHNHHHPHRAAANDHALTTQLAAVPCSIPRALDTTSTGLQHQHLHDSLVTGITSHAPLVTGITSHAPLVTGLPSHAPTVVPSPPASHAHFLFSLRGSGNPHFPSERRFLSALPPPLPHPAHSTPPSPITPTTVVRSPGSVAFDSNSRAYAPTTDYTGSAHCHYNVVRATGHTGSHRHASIPPFPLS